MTAFQTIGVNQAPGNGTDYPFKKPSADVRYVLGDLFLAYTDSSLVLPFRVVWLYGFGTSSTANPDDSHTPTHAYDMVILDANDAVAFDSTAADFSSSAWGTSLTTIQWINGDTVLRCTARSNNPPWAPSRIVDLYIAPQNGELDARSVYLLPRRLRSIRVGVTVFEPGNLVLAEGFNINLSVDPQVRVDGGRYTRSIRIRGLPGDGLGRSPACGDVSPAILRINTVAPDAGGNMLLDAAGCYRVQRPATITGVNPRTAVANSNGLQLFNDCAPCCTCDDFLRTYEGIRRLYNRFSDLGQRADNVRNLLDSNIARWNAQRDCRLASALRLTVMTEPGCVLYLGASYCNMTQGCAAAMMLRLTFEAFRDGTPYDFSDATAQCRQTVRSGSDTQYQEVPFIPQGPYPVFDSVFDYADPQAPSVAKMRFNMAGCGATDVVRITLTAHAPDPVGPDGTVYHLPLPAVPTSVTDLWAMRPPANPARAILVKTIPINPNTCACC